MGEFKGKNIGYKGFIREEDNAICIITLCYDKSYKDPVLKDARYSRLCFVKDIEVLATGEKLASVSGYCCAHFTYTKDLFILHHNIFFFPDTLRNAKERAANYARNSLIFNGKAVDNDRR